VSQRERGRKLDQETKAPALSLDRADGMTQPAPPPPLPHHRYVWEILDQAMRVNHRPGQQINIAPDKG
jgi:hypothetical protein